MSLRRGPAALALAASLLAASVARADDDAGDIVPPVAIEAGTAPYPAGEQDPAVVVVKIVVNETGHVTDVELVAGEDPFASAVLATARRWTFTPATRDGKPIAVRVRMRVSFRPPAPEPMTAPEPVPLPKPVARPTPTPKPKPKPAPTPLPAPVVEELPEEVHVRGKRNEIGQTQMSGNEVRQMPGAFGDAFRAIEALPGVTPIVSGLPFFFVRGAPPGNTGYFIDGVRVPLLYHLALGPSVIHPGLIERVDFYPGGYPARYGRYAGGILDGEILPPASKPHGEANIRLFDVGVLAETPAIDGKLTVLASGRYSYTAPLVSLFAPDNRVAYWDYQTRAAYRVTPKDTISLFWFGSFDEVDARVRNYIPDPNGGNIVGVHLTPFFPVFKTEFHRADLRWDHDTPRGHVRVAATLGTESSLAGDSQQIGNNETVINSTSVAATSFGLRMEGEERETDWLKLRYGADSQLYNYVLHDSTTNSGAGALYPSRNDVMIGAYTDAIWKASSRIEVVPGLRFDVFTSRLARGQPAGGPTSLTNATAEVGVDPRLATRVTITDRVAWLTTFGVAHQPPSLTVPVPGLTLGRLNDGLQTSLQASQGFEVKLPYDFTATATGYLHDYLGLTDATATCVSLQGGLSIDNPAGSECLAEKVTGRAYGLEVFLRRDFTKRFTGWLSYTLSRSTRETHGLTATGSPGAAVTEIVSEFDRTHVLNLIGAFDLGSGWRAGSRFVFYTGRPYTPTIEGVPIPPFNSERLPPFFRIDVRLEKRWRVFGRGHLSFVIEGMNVTLTKEALYVKCDPSTGNLVARRFDTCTPQYIGPISVPSIGLEGSL